MTDTILKTPDLLLYYTSLFAATSHCAVTKKTRMALNRAQTPKAVYVTKLLLLLYFQEHGHLW